MNYEIVPSMKCFRCFFFLSVGDSFCFCSFVNRDITDNNFDLFSDCIFFVPDCYLYSDDLDFL